jgi:DNA uptake protein ComE-like DNA-binding protein
MSLRSRELWVSAALLSLLLALTGCDVRSSSDQDRRAQDEKTKDDTAKAVEKAKPALQEAGRDIAKAANAAAEEVRAAAQGAKEGWQRGGHSAVDLNSATETDLTALPGVTPRTAKRIIAHRPYRDKHDLVSKGVLSESAYDKISDDVETK